MHFQLVLRRYTKKANLQKVVALLSRTLYLPEHKIEQLLFDQPRIVCGLASQNEGELIQESLYELGCITEIEPLMVDDNNSNLTLMKKHHTVLKKEMSKALRSRTCLGLFWMHLRAENSNEILPSMMGDFLSPFGAYFRESDTIIGMDESQILLLGFATDRKGAVVVKSKVKRALNELLPMHHTVKIGVSIFPDEGRSISQLLLQAQPVQYIGDAIEQIDIRSNIPTQKAVDSGRQRDKERIGTIQLHFSLARGRFLNRLLKLDAKALWHGLSTLTRKQQQEFLYRLPYHFKLAPTLQKIISLSPRVAPDMQLEKHLEEVIFSMTLEEGLEDRKRNASSIVSKLNDVEALPVLPGIALKLFNILSDPDAMITALAKVIETDPSLTLKLLKVVNSAFYGFSRKIGTVKEAVVILGTDEIKNLAFGLSAAKTFQNVHFKGMANPNALWHHSIGTAIIAERLGRKVPEYKDASAFTAGLIHDTGKIFLMEHFPKLYNDVCNTALKHKIPVVEMEEEKFELNHAVIGKVVATRWNLPDSLIQAIGSHHQPLVSSESSVLPAIIGLSDYLYHRIDTASSPEGHVFPTPFLTFGQYAVLKRVFMGMNRAFLDKMVEEMKILLEENEELFTAA
ncbi:MAG: HDOD domain-containing protein [Pseudomonadota bacterium]